MSCLPLGTITLSQLLHGKHYQRFFQYMDADFLMPWSLLPRPVFCPYYFNENTPEGITSPTCSILRASPCSYYMTSLHEGLVSSIPTLKTPGCQAIPPHLFSLLYSFFPITSVVLNYIH